MADPTPLLTDRRVLVLGLGGIARAVAAAARDTGAHVVLAGRDASRARRAASDIAADVDAVALDLADEATIPVGLDAAGPVDHVVSTASAAATGPIEDLDAAALDAAVAAKLTGPALLAKHAAARLPDDGSMTFLSGVVGWRPSATTAVMAMTNGGLAHLGAGLAVALAPRRVNVVSPGIVDSGAWDGLGDADKAALFRRTAEANPARRVGAPADVAQVVLLALTNPFVTGTVLHVDGGGRWASAA